MKERLIGLIKTYILFVCIFYYYRSGYLYSTTVLCMQELPGQTLSRLSGMVYPSISRLPDI